MAVTNRTRRTNGSPKFSPFQNPTPQGKLIEIANKFGNKGLKKMQGSTIIIYDSLQLTEGLNANGFTFNFFKGVANRDFPFTNLQENKFQVGEGLALQRMYFAILTTLVATGEVTNVQTFAEFTTFGLYKSDVEIRQVNNVILKSIPLTSMKSTFNKSAMFDGYDVFEFETDVTFQPLLQFQLTFQAPAITIPTSATSDFRIMCAWEGPGAIMNPRSNF